MNSCLWIRLKKYHWYQFQFQWNHFNRNVMPSIFFAIFINIQSICRWNIKSIIYLINHNIYFIRTCLMLVDLFLVFQFQSILIHLFLFSNRWYAMGNSGTYKWWFDARVYSQLPNIASIYSLFVPCYFVQYVRHFVSSLLKRSNFNAIKTVFGVWIPAT